MSELITDAMVEVAAKSMADDWNPERDPILTAMLSDYAATALEAAAPLIAAKALRDAAEALAALPSAAVGYGRHDSIGARKGRARQDERGVIGHWLRARADAERGES